jgi:AcrR family transcriptional regulator
MSKMSKMSSPTPPRQMEKSSPRVRRREANLARITQAATEIVVEEGIEALSIKRVADDALYTPGALYRYFDSKDALLSAVAIVLMGRVKERLLAIALRADGEHLDSAVAQILTYCNYAKEDPHGFALLARMVSEPGHLVEDNKTARPVLDAMFETLAPLADALEQAAESGILSTSNAMPRAVVLFAAVQGVLMLRKQERLNPVVIQTDLFVRELIRTLLVGWGADHTAVELAIASTEKLGSPVPGGGRA